MYTHSAFYPAVSLSLSLLMLFVLYSYVVSSLYFDFDPKITLLDVHSDVLWHEDSAFNKWNRLHSSWTQIYFYAPVVLSMYLTFIEEHE